MLKSSKYSCRAQSFTAIKEVNDWAHSCTYRPSVIWKYCTLFSAQYCKTAMITALLRTSRPSIMKISPTLKECGFEFTKFSNTTLNLCTENRIIVMTILVYRYFCSRVTIELQMKLNVEKKLGWSANCWPSQPKVYPTIYFWSRIHLLYMIRAFILLKECNIFQGNYFFG